MFVIPTNVGFTHRVVAMLVACATVLLSVGVYSTAQAANLTNISDTLTDSGPSVTSGHDISFTIPAGSSLGAAGTTTIEFTDVGFVDVDTVILGDLTVTVNGGATTPSGFVASGQTISFSNVTATAGQVVRVVIAGGKIVNPGTVDSYEIVVSTGTDTGRTRVAIVDYVTVSAVVETTFDFVVAGLATSSAINGTSTTGASTATEIPFGILDSNGIYTLAQELTVTTNARNGFVVTVQQDGNLQSTTGADIDGFTDGTYVNSPAAWAAPTNTLLDEDTWGHWGLTTDDSDLSGTFGTPDTGEFANGGSGDRWVAASTTPRLVFSHDGSADGTTQDYGLARVGYQVQVTPLQEAGDDYTTTLMYIATPTF